MQTIERLNTEITPTAIDTSLRQQHQEWLREGYDGHNRHPVRTTRRHLRIKGLRRFWNMRLRTMAQESNTR